MANINESIADVVRKKREKSGLTQAELSIKSSVPLRTIQGLEGGKAEPRFETIRAIAITLGLTSVELWGESKPSAALSGKVMTGPLSAADGSVILAEIEKLKPRQRELLVAMLFQDPTLIYSEDSAVLFQAVQVFQKVK